jgi:spermidine synthase
MPSSRQAHDDSGASTPAADSLLLAGVSACFVLSGFAALLYQTAWLRQFSIAFGTAELAVATVLAAYMAGLGTGAAIAGRLIDRIERPVRVYGLLEAGIAISALCVPLLLGLAGWLHVFMLGGLAQPPDSGGLLQPFYYLASSFLILALPTGFMGATLPLLTRYAAHEDEQVGPRVAWLYGVNTAGAVLGALTAAFFLLPRFGLSTTVFVGVGVNLLVFLIAATLARSFAAAATGEQAGTRDNPVARASWILPLILLSGANAFLYEVLWTRLLNHVLGGTIYAFATMLASFLTGIAIGGVLAGRLARDRTQASRMFVACQFSIAIASAGVYLWLQQYVPAEAGLAGNASLAAIVILPSTLFIGISFPLAVRILADNAEDASPSTAKVYAWNTAGAIVGSVLAGFFLIPSLGFEGAIRLAVGVNLFIGVATLFFATRARLLPIAITFGAAAAVFFYRPQVPLGLIDTSVVDSGRGGEPLFYAVGRSATVFLKRLDGVYHLRTNGLPEAQIEPAGAPPMRHGQKWLTALPTIARPDADSVLIVGFGGGVAIEGVPPGVSEIDIIELEPEVIAANREIAAQRRYDPLADERIRIVLNDARNALALTDKTYDVIVSQPSHPWTAGASHLYTSEFAGLAKGNLAPGGVFAQWINSGFVDEPLLRSLTATLFSQFSHVRLYQPAPTVLLYLASDKSLELETSLSASGWARSDIQTHYSHVGINAPEDLLVALAAGREELRRFARGAPINSDNDNRMAMFSRSGSDGLTDVALFEVLDDYDPLLVRDSWIHVGETPFDLRYVGDRLIKGGFVRRAAALRRVVRDESTSRTIDGIGLRRAGHMGESTRAFAAALQADVGNERARYAFVWPYLGRLAADDAPEAIRDAARQLDGSGAAVVAGWKYGLRQEWSELAKLDAQLAEVVPTDPWFLEAVRLRADWRIQGSDQRSAYLEALRLLDRALIVAPDTELLVIRASATIKLGDPAAFVETAELIGKQFSLQLDLAEQGEVLLARHDIDAMRVRTAGITRELGSQFASPVRQRASEVSSGFESVGRRLGTL